MPSAVVGRQCPALSPTKKIPSAVAGRIWWGIQLPCQRSAGTPTSAARRSVGLAYVVARVERADADAQLAVGRERPRISGADVARVQPQLEVGAGGVRVDLQPARQARVGRLDALVVVEHAAPAERVDDERRAQVAAVGVHDVARADRPTLAVSNSRVAAARAAARTARR